MSDYSATTGNDSIDSSNYQGSYINGLTGDDTLLYFDSKSNYLVQTLLGVTHVSEISYFGVYSLSNILSNVETLQFTDSSTSLATTSNNVIIGQNSLLTESINGTDANDIIDHKGGSDDINGGLGIDTVLFFDNKSNFTITTLANITHVKYISSDYSSSYISSEAVLTNIEKIQFLDGVVSLVSTTDLTLTGTNLANILTGNTGNDTLIGLNGNDILKGNAGNDQLLGGLGKDSLSGGTGNDILDGSAGSDVLTGGAGQDIFRLNNAFTVDKISDFSVIDDTIQLENAVFESLENTGGLASTLFRTGANMTTAADANDYLIYNKTTGGLYYDDDGNGTEAVAVKIAVIGTITHPALTAADFMIA